MTDYPVFKVKSPCQDCPFKKGNVYLRKQRIEAFYQQFHINDSHTVYCHSTINYGVEEPKNNDNSSICAGLTILQLKTGRLPVPMRIAFALKLTSPDDYKDPNNLVWDSWNQILEAYKNE